MRRLVYVLLVAVACGPVWAASPRGRTVHGLRPHAPAASRQARAGPAEEGYALEVPEEGWRWSLEHVAPSQGFSLAAAQGSVTNISARAREVRAVVTWLTPDGRFLANASASLEPHLLAPGKSGVWTVLARYRPEMEGAHARLEFREASGALLLTRFLRAGSRGQPQLQGRPVPWRPDWTALDYLGASPQAPRSATRLAPGDPLLPSPAPASPTRPADRPGAATAPPTGEPAPAPSAFDRAVAELAEDGTLLRATVQQPGSDPVADVTLADGVPLATARTALRRLVLALQEAIPPGHRANVTAWQANLRAYEARYRGPTRERS